MSQLAIVCPGCLVTNNVSQDRLDAKPACGKCHNPLFGAAPTAVDEPGFRKMIQYSTIPVVVDFWADWCGPCKVFAPAFAAAAVELEPHVRLLKVDTEANQQIAQAFNIRSIPTLAIFRHGKEIARQSGAMPQGPFMAWVKQTILAT